MHISFTPVVPSLAKCTCTLGVLCHHKLPIMGGRSIIKCWEVPNGASLYDNLNKHFLRCKATTSGSSEEPPAQRKRNIAKVSCMVVIHLPGAAGHSTERSQPEAPDFLLFLSGPFGFYQQSISKEAPG